MFLLMLTAVIIGAGLFLLTGLAALVHAVTHAPAGSEDLLGFHPASTIAAPLGAQPAQPAAPSAHAIPDDCLVS